MQINQDDCKIYEVDNWKAREEIMLMVEKIGTRKRVEDEWQYMLREGGQVIINEETGIVRLSLDVPKNIQDIIQYIIKTEKRTV